MFRRELYRTMARALDAFDAYQQRCFTGLDVDDTRQVLSGARALLEDLDAPAPQ